LNYWTGSANNDEPDANVYGTHGLFPKKGRPVDTGSLVDLVIQHRKSHLVERITLLDDGDDEGLIAIARPLNSSKSSKVALVVLLESDQDKIAPQIERVKPVIVERFRRHLLEV